MVKDTLWGLEPSTSPFSKRPVSSSLQVSSSFLFYQSICHSSTPLIFCLLSSPLPFHFLRRSLSFFIHLCLSATMTSFHLHSCGISILSNGPLSPSLHSLSSTFSHSLFHWSIICRLFRFTNLSFIFFFLIYSSILFSLFFEVHWCFLSFMFISPFSSLILVHVCFTSFHSEAWPGPDSWAVSLLNPLTSLCIAVDLDMFLATPEVYQRCVRLLSRRHVIMMIEDFTVYVLCQSHFTASRFKNHIFQKRWCQFIDNFAFINFRNRFIYYSTLTFLVLLVGELDFCKTK